MKKRIVSALLLAAICISVISVSALADAGMQNFTKKYTYKSGQFNDVSVTDWFESGVANAYELGLVKGNRDGAFNPNGNISLAETVTLAARLHSIYTDDKNEFVQGNVWYQVYVDYCVEKGIVEKDVFSDFSAAATRAQFACIMYSALPASAFDVINTITEIPDMKNSADYAKAVLALYNAGILTGSDGKGNFFPDSNIKRSEVATILTRIANHTFRKSFSLTADESVPAVAGETQIAAFLEYFRLGQTEIENTRQLIDEYSKMGTKEDWKKCRQHIGLAISSFEMVRKMSEQYDNLAFAKENATEILYYLDLMADQNSPVSLLDAYLHRIEMLESVIADDCTVAFELS